MTQPAPPASITTPRLRLLAWAAADEPDLARTLAESDSHLRPWTPWVIDGRISGQSLAERLAQHAADFHAGTAWVYAIRALGEDAILGGCGLYARIGDGALELGYWLARGATGRGYAREAARALTAIALSLPSIQRVEIRCDPRNAASMAVPRHLGYRVTGSATNAADAAHAIVIWTCAGNAGALNAPGGSA